EPVVHTFSRTPSFGWSPVPGAVAYQFELATSERFSDSGIVWSTKGLKSPAVAVPVSLPWMTGHPYSLYAHVRAITRRAAGHWRVRATRWLYGQTDNGIPSVSYGPWSPVYTSYNPTFATGALTADATVSSVVSNAGHTRNHEIMPAFTYHGNTSIWGTTHEL